jgi:hypothetical protein
MVWRVSHLHVIVENFPLVNSQKAIRGAFRDLLEEMRVPCLELPIHVYASCFRRRARTKPMLLILTHGDQRSNLHGWTRILPAMQREVKCVI